MQVEARQVTEKEVKGSEKINALEQHGRRQNLEIIGIPETKGEDSNKLVIEVAKLPNVEVTPDQIFTSHRLPQRRAHSESTNTPLPIIAKFTNRDVRNKIYANRKLKRNLDFKHISVYGVKAIFINENLTQLRKKLF